MINAQISVYCELAKFIGRVFGNSYQISVYSFGLNKNESQIAYCSQESNTKSSYNLSEYLRILFEDIDPDQQSYVCDVVLPDSPYDRMHVYFILNNFKLIGALTITYNTAEREKIMSSLLTMLNIHCSDQSERIDKPDKEEISFIPKKISSDMLPMLVATILKENNIESGQVQLTPDEKIKIIRVLHDRGVFNFKNAVSEVASQLNSAECTIYRYLNKINRQSLEENWETVRLI